MDTFKENVDAWIKNIRREFAEFSDIPAIVQEHAENIQHNYELIYELRDEIDKLKQDINMLKLVQIITLKNKRLKEQTDIDFSITPKTQN